MQVTYRVSIRFGKVTKDMGNSTPHADHLRRFLELWSSLDPTIYPVFHSGAHKGKLCPSQMFPRRPHEIKNLMHTVYSRRSNTVCLQISVTLAGSAQFWDIQKDLNLVPELRQESIQVKKIHMEINHEATIGLLTETQSAFHYRDSIEDDARSTFNIGTHIPISVQERRFPISSPITDRNRQQFTSGLVLVTDVKYIEEAKTLCEIYGFDEELIKQREFIPKNSHVIPCQPDQSLDPETHLKLLKRHAQKMQSLTQVRLYHITSSKLSPTDPNQQSICLILSHIISQESNTVHSMTHNSKGAIILNVYKDKLAQALTIGSTLMLAIKEKTSSTEFQHIYPHPDEKLTSLVDQNSQVNQATVPRAISVSYASALIRQM